MRITYRTEYALRALFDIAYHGSGAPVKARHIAARQHISEAFLEQILSEMKDSGLLEGYRGREGGYLLQRDPAKITLLDVLMAVKESVALVPCATDIRRNGNCHNEGACAAQVVWAQTQDKICDVLRSRTLADLCAEAQVRGIPRETMIGFTYEI